MHKKLLTKIEKVLGTRVLKQSNLPVGFGLTGLRVELADGRVAALKASNKKHDHSLETESFMLFELKTHSSLPVPEIYYSDPQLLIMQWLTSAGSITPSVQKHAAELLAELHSQPFDQFGYSQDTLIGPLHQPNPRTESWLTFFRNHRLLYMADEALKEGALPQNLYDRLLTLSDQLNNYLSEPAHPSLLHGDLWSGNIISGENRISGFIDPAIYCGHPEIELAFTIMFNTFGDPFFKTYEAISPLEPGFFEERQKIYNLYPTLVHVRLFGASYLPSIDHVLLELGY